MRLEIALVLFVQRSVLDDPLFPRSCVEYQERNDLGAGWFKFKINRQQFVTPKGMKAHSIARAFTAQLVFQRRLTHAQSVHRDQHIAG